MAIPPNSMLDWNLLANKPDDVDRVNPVYDIDANEQKCQTYAVLKSFFVKTDEPTDIEAILEFQSTITKPNSILKFGSAGEFHIYSDGTDLFMKGTTAGKLRFYANSAEMLTLNPVNASIASFGKAFNYDGAAGKGLIFAVTTNRAKFTERLTCEDLLVAEGGIQMLLKNVSYTGAADTGLEFAITNVGYFKQKLVCEADLDVTGQINANKAGEWSIAVDGKSLFQNNISVLTNFISHGGTNAGLNFNASNYATFSARLTADGLFTANTGINVNGQLNCDVIDSDSHITAIDYIRGYILDVRSSVSTPSTIASYSRIFTDSADGKLKYKTGAGVVRTISYT